ncbi:MAG: YegS/Rv2252/BmrU family lipid kinase [Streptomycetaceae bacterium]|nr:MAG: YegS/Rv2252/BmrU family lipid kinase [Streptomycetaceae bacterium]
MSYAVVINPVSGRGQGAHLGSQVIAYLAEHNIDYQIVSGVNATHTSQTLAKYVKENPGSDGVFAVGGDGLAHLVIQHLANTRIPLALIPAGTGNDMVRTLGWPLDDLRSIMNAVFSTSPQYIDLGLVDGEWFAAILSTGFDSIVNERANTLKWPSGPMKYNVAIARELPGFRPRAYTIDMDGQEIVTKAMLIAVGNGISYGGGMLVCPNADITDGLFDVMILSPVSIPEFLKVFPKVYAGTHIQHPAVSIYRAKRVKIDADAIAYADGERVGSLPISAECVSKALLVWRK